jgi:hypothetical protein
LGILAQQKKVYENHIIANPSTVLCRRVSTVAELQDRLQRPSGSKDGRL